MQLLLHDDQSNDANWEDAPHVEQIKRHGHPHSYSHPSRRPQPKIQRPPQPDMMLAPQLLCLVGLALGTLHAAPSAEVKLERGTCPPFWFSFSGRCYKYVSSPMVWAAAERNCRSEDANLVSIHSDEEHNFVRTLIKSFDPYERFTWIGLSDTQMEGWWMWSDGTNTGYTAWHDGMPSGGNCVLTNCGSTGKWCDWECSHDGPSVCALRTVSP